jgi:hypothetical protein
MVFSRRVYVSRALKKTVPDFWQRALFLVFRVLSFLGAQSGVRSSSYFPEEF